MRILGSVVAPSTSLVALRDPQITGCSPIRSEIIRDEFVGDKAIFLQKLAHEFQRRTLVPFRLDQHIEDLALGIDGAPQIDQAAKTSSNWPLRTLNKPHSSSSIYGSPSNHRCEQHELPRRASESNRGARRSPFRAGLPSSRCGRVKFIRPTELAPMIERRRGKATNIGASYIH